MLKTKLDWSNLLPLVFLNLDRISQFDQVNRELDLYPVQVTYLVKGDIGLERTRRNHENHPNWTKLELDRSVL